MSRGAVLTAALAGLAALLAVPRRGARRPVRKRLPARPWPPWLLPRRDPPDTLATADLADRLAALGRAGVPEQRAWRLLAEAGGTGAAQCAVVTAMLQAGGTAADGLRRAALDPALPGDSRARLGGQLPGLDRLALVLDVVRRAGAPAAEPLQRMAQALRADAEAEAERQAVLAGPRATARLLAWLPLGGLLLGWAIGADPVRALLGTPPGRGCLVAGIVLWAAGRWWTVRLVAGAARAGG